MVKSKRKKRMALQGKSGLHISLKCFLASSSCIFRCSHFDFFNAFFFCSPPHVKSEPDDNSYYSPKHEKSLKRERDDDNE